MAGSGTATIDFGATPTADAQFTMTDAAITGGSYVEAWPMVDSTVDNDTDAHRFAAVSWKSSTLPASGSFTLYVTCLAGMCTGTFKIRYAYA